MYVPLECHRNSYLSTAQIALGAWDTEIWPSGSGWCVCVCGGGVEFTEFVVSSRYTGSRNFINVL